MSRVASTPSMSSCNTLRSLQRNVMVPESPETLGMDRLRLSIPRPTTTTRGGETSLLGLDVMQGGTSSHCACPSPSSAEQQAPQLRGLPLHVSPLLDGVYTTQQKQPQV